jgi:hypothetical protein
MAQDWSDETPLSLEFISPFTQMTSTPSHSPFLRQARVLAVVVRVDSDDEINDDMKNTKQMMHATFPAWAELFSSNGRRTDAKHAAIFWTDEKKKRSHEEI